MKIYIVGVITAWAGSWEIRFPLSGVFSSSWEVKGIYEKKEDAEKACTTKAHFVAPWTLNQEFIVGQKTKWVGVYYPRRI